MALDALRHLRLDQHVDLDAVLQSIVDEVARRLGADRGTLYLVDHARAELISRVAHLPELAEIRLRLGEGVAGWVAQTGEPVIVPDSPHDARFDPRIDSLTGYTTDSILAVPVRRGDAVIGVMQVLNKADGLFNAADLAHLARLADDIAAILDRTSLRSQLRPSAGRPLAFRFNHIVGESPAMQVVFDRTARAARTDATVLVRGESGSGKEAIARAVHTNSPRRAQPFVKVDCAALPEQLIENELFGHEKGAYTGADTPTHGKVRMAHAGTLFLDEVGELPLSVQGKLLRLLQDRVYLRVGGTRQRSVDVRFVCATHRDLEADVRAGRFRQDLYYRLRVVQIVVPPLRERGAADLDRLIDHFVYEKAHTHGRPDLDLSLAARTTLHAHAWPGNVRELENCIESAVVLTHGSSIQPGDLSIHPIEPPALAHGDAFTSGIGPLRVLERAYIQHVVERCDGNRTQAARILGIGRNTLLRKLDGK